MNPLCLTSTFVVVVVVVVVVDGVDVSFLDLECAGSCQHSTSGGSVLHQQYHAHSPGVSSRRGPV